MQVYSSRDGHQTQQGALLLYHKRHTLQVHQRGACRDLVPTGFEARNRLDDSLDAHPECKGAANRSADSWASYPQGLPAAKSWGWCCVWGKVQEGRRVRAAGGARRWATPGDLRPRSGSEIEYVLNRIWKLVQANWNVFLVRCLVSGIECLMNIIRSYRAAQLLCFLAESL